MKKSSTLLVFIFCCSIRLVAQQDSTQNNLLQKQIYFSDSAAMTVFDFAKYNPLLIKKLLPNQISKISIGHQLEQGNFIAAQGSTKTNIAFLGSEGTTELSGIKLYGAFSYNKVFEDSTRFSHQTRNNTTTPYYFGSPTNNHYERAIYSFKTVAAKNLFSDKIMVGLGLDYHIADHFSNNDPRGSIKEYKFDLLASLGYNFNQNILLGFAYHTGYGQETVNIGYKNRSYYESISYPNYVNYLINGYGEPNPKTNDRKYNNHQNRNGFEAILKAENTAMGSFYLTASKIEEKQQFDYRNDGGIVTLSDYHLSELDLNLLWTKKIANNFLTALLTYQNTLGEDFNINFLAKNYIYTSNNFKLKINYTLKNGLKNHNYHLTINQLDEERLDGITGNQVYFKNLMLNAGYGINKVINKNKSIGIDLGIHYGLSLADKFSVGTSVESYFTRYVIFHDYLYNTAGKLGGSLGAHYGFPFFNVMQSAIKLNLVYTANHEMKSLERILVTTPGNDRFFSNISFNLYF